MENFEVGGMTIIGASEDTKNVLTGRDLFIDKYCKERGWHKEDLSFEQIIEVRNQAGWINPGA